MKYTTALLVFAAAAVSAATTEGWKVPANQPNGVYSVHLDEATGEQVHTFLRPLTAENTKPALRVRGQSARSAAISGDLYCAGDHLNNQDTDAANNALDAQCGNGAPVTPAENGRDFYSISNDVVAYFCNTSGNWNHCFAGERQDADRQITARCGWYWAGDLTSPSWGQTASVYGYQLKWKNFCGRGVNGRVEN